MTSTASTTAGDLAAGPTKPSSSRAGLAIAVLSAASFGLSGTLASAMLALGWSPVATVATRVGGAFLVLLIPCLLLIRRTGLPDRRQTRGMVAYGVVAVAGAQLCYFSAVQYLSVGVALLLEYLAPVLLIGYRWLRDRQRPTVPVLAGAALAVLGLALVLDLRNGLTVNPIGVVWALGAAVCLMAYFVLSEERPGVVPVSPLLLTTVGTGVGAVLLLGIGLTGVLPLRVAAGRADLGGLDVPWWVPMALLVLVAAVLAYLTGIAAVRRLGSAVASFVALTEVLFAVAFAALLLDQRPGGDQVLGGVLVLAGIVAVQSGGTLDSAWRTRRGRAPSDRS
jgi:drug/metabolite transporter (DMT)-like permease